MIFFAALVVIIACTFFCSASAWHRDRASTIIQLPKGLIQPESVTIDNQNYIYSSLYNPTGTGVGQIVRFKTNGRQLTVLNVQGATTGLAGMHFRKSVGDILIVDNVASSIFSFNPLTFQASLFVKVPLINGNTVSFLNDLTEDSQGNVYITDSYQGAIFKTSNTGTGLSTWSASTLLLVPGGLGANGIAIDPTNSFVIVAVTSSSTIYKIPINPDGSAGTFQKFCAVYGPDGLRLDSNGNVWITSNAGSEIDIFNSAGAAIDVKGDFNGIDSLGVPHGLIGPASLVYNPATKHWVVVNAGFSGLGLFSSYVAGTGGVSVGEKIYTIARIPNRLTNPFTTQP